MIRFYDVKKVLVIFLAATTPPQQQVQTTTSRPSKNLCLLLVFCFKVLSRLLIICSRRVMNIIKQEKEDKNISPKNTTHFYNP